MNLSIFCTKKYIICTAIVLAIIVSITLATISKLTEEKYCQYVSSHGIKNSFARNKQMIYVKSDQLPSFVIPNHKFVLITGDEDTTIPNDVLDKANEILNHPNLIHWFSQNLAITHAKMSAIPIGLHYHALKKNKDPAFGPKTNPKLQEKFILELPRKNFSEREKKIYCNFLHSIRGFYGKKDRQEAIDSISHDLIVFENNFVPVKATFQHMVQYAFVLSPLGNGLDCHRTWEALVLGAIPIVKTSVLDLLYQDLPVLIVQEWSDVNEKLLNETIVNFSKRSFDYEKLTLNYWIAKIYATYYSG